MKEYKCQKFFTFDGKRYCARGDTWEEVYEKKANKLRDLKEGRITINGSTTVRDWTKICLETYKPNVSDEVMSQMRYRIDKHILDEIGARPIKSITPLDCQRIMTRQSKMSASHVRKLNQELHFIFEKAKNNHMILENPADNLSIPSGVTGKRRSITDEERKHFLLVADKYEPFMLFLLMLNCGCRPGEAANCIGKDVYIEKKTPMLHIRGTKTALSDRHVPIPEHLYPLINKKRKDELLAPNNAGKHHDESSYRRLSDRLRREMNISMGCKVYRNALVPPLPLAEDFVPYFFRHTYCTDLQKAGVDVRVAQRLMGHASIEITANIYTHVDMDDIANAARMINKAQGCCSGCCT